MKRNIFFTLILIAAFLVTIFLWVDISPLRAQGDTGVLWKLNKVVEKQDEIITRLVEIKAGLDEIKSKMK